MTYLFSHLGIQTFALGLHGGKTNPLGGDSPSIAPYLKGVGVHAVNSKIAKRTTIFRTTVGLWDMSRTWGKIFWFKGFIRKKYYSPFVLIIKSLTFVEQNPLSPLLINS